MRRHNESEKYELSDAEKRDLIKLIDAGKPICERLILRRDLRRNEGVLISYPGCILSSKLLLARAIASVSE